MRCNGTVFPVSVLYGTGRKYDGKPVCGKHRVCGQHRKCFRERHRAYLKIRAGPVPERILEAGRKERRSGGRSQYVRNDHYDDHRMDE